jgi:dienelactone hydrolase
MISMNSYSNRIILLSILCFSLHFSYAQPCAPLTLDSISNPGIYFYSSLTETDGIRNGPDYNGATIYYPTNATPPYASIAIVPGYVSPQSSIQNWGPFLASHGIVAMTIGTNSLFDYPEDRKNALLDALVTLEEENTRVGSPLLGNIDVNKFAVGGWSMGGGGAQLAAAEDNSIKAVMALCPWLETGLTAANDLDHPVPVLIFSAEYDAIAPHADHADVHYAYTPQTTSKMLFEIAGGDHSVANDPIGGGHYVGKIAVSWLKYYLLDDVCYCPLVLDTPATASKYLLNIDCPGIMGSFEEISSQEVADFRLYPNPASSQIKIEVNELSLGANYQIISMTGKTVFRGEILSQSTSIGLLNLAPGLYLFNLNTTESSKQKRFIVQ